MRKLIYIYLAALLIITGCVKDHSRAPHSEDNSRTLSVKGPDDSASFTAEGTGQSDTEARNQALSEMSRRFEARVISDTYDRTSAIVDAAGETFMAHIEDNIRVISAVKLEGARIERTWFENEKGIYHAIAVLDRHQAGENWQSEIKDIDNKIEGEFRLLDSIDSKFLKFGSLMTILNHWIEREVLVSRLRVLGFSDTSTRSFDIMRVFNMVPQIKAGMLVFLEVTGEYGNEMENKLSEALNKAGFVISDKRNKADVLITGRVEAGPVELNNPGWKFTRARVSLTIVDALTGSAVGEVSDDARAGHTTYKEAVHNAVKKIAVTASEKLIEYFQ
ncbi:MAG: LPP20 family lipoprotein [Nitrospirae bacterium]|nr:LPP20 family lipoprotein [Nitrospirota bacterium]